MEEAALLLAVHRIVGGIEVEDQARQIMHAAGVLSGIVPCINHRLAQPKLAICSARTLRGSRPDANPGNGQVRLAKAAAYAASRRHFADFE